MTKEEAFQILKCNEPDDVQDAFDDALFEHKKKFLQVIPPLKLIKATQKKIDRLCSAYYEFFPNEESVNRVEVIIEKHSTLDLYLESHQIELSRIRLDITGSVDGQKLIDAIEKLAGHQIKLFIKLSTYLGLKDVEDFPIKLSEEINVYKLQTELKSLQIDDTKISEYIRSQIEKLDFEQFTYVTIAVINAEKQMTFNELRIRR